MKKIIEKMSYRRLISILICSSSLLFGNLCSAEQWSSAHRESINAYIEEVAQQHDYSVETLKKYLGSSEYRQDILDAITHPAEAKPWYFYRSFFANDPKRLNNGLAFWKKHEQTLKQAEDKFGVPAQYIVAILGIESMYGEIQGKYRVLDALSTLAFAHPTRGKFFRDELTEYLLLLREHQFSPDDLYGSYAGAFGQAQFMPSSYRNFAISADSKGHSDLVHNADDAIFSIANYLRKNGWVPTQPVASKTKVTGQKYKDVVAKSRRYKLNLTQNQLAELNIKPDPNVPLDTKAMLIELQSNKLQKEYWLGFQNFYAITRYNPSANYAMAVYMLGNNLEKSYQQFV